MHPARLLHHACSLAPRACETYPLGSAHALSLPDSPQAVSASRLRRKAYQLYLICMDCFLQQNQNDSEFHHWPAFHRSDRLQLHSSDQLLLNQLPPLIPRLQCAKTSSPPAAGFEQAGGGRVLLYIRDARRRPLGLRLPVSSLRR